MVRDAAWEDLNADGKKELILVGIWMPVSVFGNEGGKLVDVTSRYFNARYTGLWHSLLVDDLNKDGLKDLVIGNLGLNTHVKASQDQPLTLYYADFDNNGTVDPLFTYFENGQNELLPTLDGIRLQIPNIASRFSSHKDYAGAKISDLFRDTRLEEATKLEAGYLETSLFVGSKEGVFSRSPLPVEAQFSPVFELQSVDYNQDGNLDLILAGNTNEAQIQFGKHDASHVMLFKGRGDASYAYVPQPVSGFKIREAVRQIVPLNQTLVFGLNRAPLKAYALKINEESP